jgi:hypothetical protein
VTKQVNLFNWKRSSIDCLFFVDHNRNIKSRISWSNMSTRRYNYSR